MARNRRRDDDDDDNQPDKPRSDAYVGMLAISLVALITGIVMLYIDFDELEKSPAPAPSITLSDDGLALPRAGVPAKA
jgi:hypothetical protein